MAKDELIEPGDVVDRHLREKERVRDLKEGLALKSAMYLGGTGIGLLAANSFIDNGIGKTLFLLGTGYVLGKCKVLGKAYHQMKGIYNELQEAKRNVEVYSRGGDPQTPEVPGEFERSQESEGLGEEGGLETAVTY